MATTEQRRASGFSSPLSRRIIEYSLWCLFLGNIVDAIDGFVPCPDLFRPVQHHSSLSLAVENNAASNEEAAKISRLKKELLDLASETQRGFKASRTQRDKARHLVFELARFNPTREPLSSYYTTTTTSSASFGSNIDEEDKPLTLAGKWTLVYTDAPDITGLDSSSNPFATATLGRIGQECDPPRIANVIEWKRPNWAAGLPLIGGSRSDNVTPRIVQKVVTQGTASPERPAVMNLKLAGFQVENPDTAETSRSFPEALQEEGLVAGWLATNPLDVQGPLGPLPFGQFEVLYLDEEMRAIRTGQNYLAVNQRIATKEDEWF